MEMSADAVVTRIQALQSSYIVTADKPLIELRKVQEALAAWWEQFEIELEKRATHIQMEASDVEDSHALHEGSFELDGVWFHWKEQADGSVAVETSNAGNIYTHSMPVLQIAAQFRAERALQRLRLQDGTP